MSCCARSSLRQDWLCWPRATRAKRTVTDVVLLSFFETREPELLNDFAIPGNINLRVLGCFTGRRPLLRRRVDLCSGRHLRQLQLPILDLARVGLKRGVERRGWFLHGGHRVFPPLSWLASRCGSAITLSWTSITSCALPTLTPSLSRSRVS